MENLSQVKIRSAQTSVSANQHAREMLVVLVLNTLICSLVAFFVWVVLPVSGPDGLFRSWVYSQSIGQTICIGSLVLSYILRIRHIESRVYEFIGFCFIVPIGFFLGKQIAVFLLADSSITPKDGHIFWSSLLVTIFVSLFSILFYTAWQHVTALKLAAAEESARASRAKLSMLQAQVEPHMLFNTLSNLRALIDSDSAKAQYMLDHLVDYLRATLAGSQNDSASLKEEFVLLDNYLSLMEIRMGERLTYDLDLPIELDQVMVPALILQPIVENAIIHGLEPTIEGGHISVRARAKNGFVAIDVSDTGIGYNMVDQTSSGGFGLQSVRERLQPTRDGFEVLSISSPPVNNASGTQVSVRIGLPKRQLAHNQSRNQKN